MRKGFGLLSIWRGCTHITLYIESKALMKGPVFMSAKFYCRINSFSLIAKLLITLAFQIPYKPKLCSVLTEFQLYLSIHIWKSEAYHEMVDILVVTVPL